MLPIGLQEAPEHRQVPVAGEAQVADAAVLLLLHEIVKDAVLGVQVGVDVHLAHVVKQIEVEIIHPALFQLLLKDLPYLGHVGQVIAGELVSQIEPVPGVLGQGLSHHQLGIAAVVAPGGVVVVHPAGHGLVHQSGGRRLVHLGVVPVHDGQAHTAHTQGGQLQVLKFFVDHMSLPLSRGRVGIVRLPRHTLVSLAVSL